VDNAIKSLVTKSANDMAVAIAEHLAGSEEAFARQMTIKARSLGMSRTNFANASGLPDPEQVTTAHDLTILGRSLQERFPKQYAYFSLPGFQFGGATIRNHNKLLGRIEGVDGIKTGFTNASGYNLMASAERGGRRVIAIMLGGKTGKSRDAHVRDLIEAAFLEIGGGVVSDDDLRTQIAFGERGNVSADDLALAQLRRLQRHSVSINRAAPMVGVSTVNTEQAKVLAAFKVKKPDANAQMSLL
jgi:D-alanyl-D-alanine carboxypeptidase